jgi:glycosyltransferase involved in cell wall biosynthesis
MPEIKNICFVGSGSIDRHATIKRAFGMSPWLRKMGVNVAIVCEDSSANRNAADNADVKIETYVTGGIVKELRQKLAILQKQNYDLVHICGLGWRNHLRLMGRLKGMAIMDHVELESSLTDTSPVRRVLQRYLEWKSLSEYDGAVVASKYLETRFSKKQRGRIQYLPFGADPIPSNACQHADHLRSSFKLTRYVLYAGGLYANYGIWTLISAVRLVLAYCPDFQLVIAGRGPEERAIRTTIERHSLEKNIKMVGYLTQNELDGLMLQAAGLLAPLNDTVADKARCPSKIPMYIMAGKPVITCKIGEAWEYLKDAGRYYSPGNPESLSQQFRNLWSASHVAKSPPKDAVSWEQITSTYLEFWRK